MMITLKGHFLSECHDDHLRGHFISGCHDDHLNDGCQDNGH